MGDKTGEQKLNIAENLLKYDFNIRTKLLGNSAYGNMEKRVLSLNEEGNFDEIKTGDKNCTCELRTRALSHIRKFSNHTRENRDIYVIRGLGEIPSYGVLMVTATPSGIIEKNLSTM